MPLFLELQQFGVAVTEYSSWLHDRLTVPRADDGLVMMVACNLQ